MGTPKAELAWQGSTLAMHVAHVLQETVDVVVAVAAPSQTVPALPDAVEVVRDEVAFEGPLRGMEAGLRAVGARADVVFVAAVDLPHLHPAFVRALLDELTDDVDAVIPVAHGYRHPLAAAYRTSVLGAVTAALAAGDRGPGVMLERVRARTLDETALLALPGVADLRALENVNTPDEFERARGSI